MERESDSVSELCNIGVSLPLSLEIFPSTLRRVQAGATSPADATPRTAVFVDWRRALLPPPPPRTLQYAELPPAPLQTTPEAEALFEEKATEVCSRCRVCLCVQ